MTTKDAEQRYLREHLTKVGDASWAIVNPHGKSIDDPPVTYGFNNGGSPGWYSGVLIAEDGTCLGGHVCSHEGYMPHDLGVLDGARPDRHETFLKHYPDGYRMEFVGFDDVKDHPKLWPILTAIKQQPAD